MRKIRTVQFTYDDVSNRRVDERVNAEIDAIAKDGGKVVSVTVNSFGFSPTLLIYTIIFEGA